MKSNIVGYIKKRINQNKLLCIIGIIASFGLFFSIYFGFIKGKIIENVGFLAISRNIIVFFVIAFIVLFLLLYIANKKQVKLHKTFFICSMVLGLVYMTLIPPLVAPDEPIHFYRAYEISNKMMGIKVPEGKTIKMRQGDISYLNKNWKAPKGKVLLEKDEYRYLGEDFFAGFNNGEKEYKTVKLVSHTAYIVPYLPSSLGFTLGRLMGLSTISIITLGRLFNLIIFSLLVALAIKIIPFGKMTLMMVALLPISIQQAMAISYDMLLNSLSFLLISFLLYLAYEKETVSNKDIVLLGVLTVLLAPIKIVYILLAGLFFLIPARKFSKGKDVYSTDEIKKGKRKKYGIISLVGALGIVGIIVFSFARISSSFLGRVGFHNLNEYFTSFGSFGHLLKMLLKTFRKIDWIFTSAIGGQMGWMEFGIPTIGIVAFVVLILLSVFKEEKKLSLWFKPFAFFLFVLIYIGVALGALAWTPTGFDNIEGIQGRYFLPILPLVFFLFANNKIKVKNDMGDNLLYYFGFTQMFSVAWIFAMVFQ